MFFDRFDPADVDPRHLVERQRDRRWLTEILSRYLALEGPPTGRAVCVSGLKGVGKSILTRAVLDDLRRTHGANTLFLMVDCRACHARRGVLRAVANAVVRELDALRRATAPVPDALMATAQLMRTIARFDDVSVRVAHEQTRQFRGAVALSTHGLLDALKLTFGLALGLPDKQIKALTGAVRIDDTGLTEALVALLGDLRAQGFGVVLYLDNIDELRHGEFNDGSARQAVRRDVEGVLALKAAPIGLVLNMRTYYTGVIPREISNTRVLRPLEAPALQAILHRRMLDERAGIREALARPESQAVLEVLARMAPTPLAFLRWVKFLFEEGMFDLALLDDGLREFLGSYYSNVDLETLSGVAWAFERPDRAVDHGALLAACHGNLALLEHLQGRQVVLPRDFWNPTQFTLDPELYFLHPSVRGPGAQAI
jgi:hypothetical protein